MLLLAGWLEIGGGEVAAGRGACLAVWLSWRRGGVLATTGVAGDWSVGGGVPLAARKNAD